MEENNELYLACEEGNSDVVARLLKEGVNHSCRDICGWTPLHYAANHWHSRCIQLLCNAGSDASAVTNSGCIPLHRAYGSTECTALLITAYPAGVHAVDKFERTPLHYGAEFGTVDVCTFLLNAGSVIDIVDKHGYTPLYWALRWNRRNVGELLFDRGAQLERVKLDKYLKAIPEWALQFLSHRNACKEISKVVTSLRIPGMDPQLLKVMGKYVWSTRKNANW